MKAGPFQGGAVIYAEPTSGKTTFCRDHYDSIDEDEVWHAWTQAQHLRGWDVCADQLTLARFRVDCADLFAELVRAGNDVFVWDPALAWTVQRMTGSPALAIMLDDADDYAGRTLHRFRAGEKGMPPSGEPTWASLTERHARNVSQAIEILQGWEFDTLRTDEFVEDAWRRHKQHLEQPGSHSAEEDEKHA